MKPTALLVASAMLLIGCGLSIPRPDPVLRTPTPLETQLLADIRRDGAAVMVDGCVQRLKMKENDQEWLDSSQRPIGRQESVAFGQRSGVVLKRLAEANGISVKSVRQPFICGSHAHLSPWHVGADVSERGTQVELPVVHDPRLREDTALRQAYRQLFALFVDAVSNDVPDRRCQWCWSSDFRQSSGNRELLSRDQAQRLRQDLGSRWVIARVDGGALQTTGKKAREFTLEILLTIVLMKDAGGFFTDHDYTTATHRVLDLGSPGVSLAFIKWGYGSGRYPFGSDHEVQNELYPLLGNPPHK